MRQLKITQQITTRETLSLDKYLQDISKLDLISADMEADLARRIRQGDAVALDKLTKANLRFVVSVAKQYQNHGLSLGDLISEGNLGLIRAGMRFDETRGFKFISYAVWWIRQAILQAVAEQSRVVRLPLNRVSALSRMQRTFGELEQKFQREPTAQELAEVMNVTIEDVEASVRATGRHASVDAPFFQGEESTLLDVLSSADTIEPDAALMTDSLKKEIARALSALSNREAEVLSCYYGLNGVASLTLEEIGDRYGLTRERVRQIRESGTKRLRGLLRNRSLKSYL
jgi:RNA polymerase primary sigma factor